MHLPNAAKTKYTSEIQSFNVSSSNDPVYVLIIPQLTMVSALCQ